MGMGSGGREVSGRGLSTKKKNGEKNSGQWWVGGGRAWRGVVEVGVVGMGGWGSPA